MIKQKYVSHVRMRKTITDFSYKINEKVFSLLSKMLRCRDVHKSLTSSTSFIVDNILAWILLVNLKADILFAAVS